MLLGLCGAGRGIARADALDTFGFGARAEALGGAITGDATGAEAAFHNPGGVARSSEVAVSIGYGYGFARLTVDGAGAGVTSPHGLSIGAAIPIGGGRGVQVAFGLALYLPDQFVARIDIAPATEPHFVLLENSLDRIVVNPVLSVRVGRVAVGAGVTLLADAAGNGVSFDVGVVGGEKVGRSGLDVSLPIRAAPVAGITVELSRRLRLGLAYRGSVDLGVKLDILANVNIAGAVTGDALISLRAVNHFTPQRLTLGTSFDVTPSLTAMAELAWVDWSAFRGGSPDVRILLALGVSPPLLSAPRPPDRFSDTWLPRAGLEYRRRVHRRVGLAGRLGFAFERSPVPDQTGVTSFADSDRVVVSAGAGVELADVVSVVDKPLRFDVALGWHELIERVTEKDPRLFPGRGFTSGGRLIHLAATLEARF